MAITFTAVEIATGFGQAAAASRVRPRLARVTKSFNRGGGGFSIVLGAVVPLRA